jgi:GT2 family glycosyltransferase
MFTSLLVVVEDDLPLVRAFLEGLRETAEGFELCVVDNGATDGTGAYFDRFPDAYSLRYRKNPTRVGLVRGLNQAVELATRDFLCVLRGDVVPQDPRWLTRLRSALMDAEDVGLAGLCGARRLGRDGRYQGVSIVSSLARGGNVDRPVMEVASVDGVGLCLRRDLLVRLGGFEEGFGCAHGWDRDLSLAVRAVGLRTVVVRAPFGVAQRGGVAPARPGAATLVECPRALAALARKWRQRLPCDVRSVGRRVAEWFAAPAPVWTTTAGCRAP